ncbi:MAG: pro-sigmaK processing inhibitor BofA family protein [Clostridia bacterium]|nr:pro-sigmaK processing inhibitor BofA family protein [Clostridia bacterium]
MQFLKIFAIIVLSVTALILLALYIKSRKPVKNLIVNAFSGIAVLVIINLSARFTGIHIPVNWWSVLTASGLGIPGVTGLILLQIIMPL